MGAEGSWQVEQSMHQLRQLPSRQPALARRAMQRPALRPRVVLVLMLLPGCRLACRVMPQYLQKGPDGRAPMDSVLNFPIYYKLTDVFASQKDMRM